MHPATKPVSATTAECAKALAGPSGAKVYRAENGKLEEDLSDCDLDARP